MFNIISEGGILLKIFFPICFKTMRFCTEFNSYKIHNVYFKKKFLVLFINCVGLNITFSTSHTITNEYKQKRILSMTY